MSTNLVLDEEPFALDTPDAATKSSAAGNRSSCETYSRGAFSDLIPAIRRAGPIGGERQLGADFAHQLNNLLTVILGHTEFLLKRKESPEISRSRVEEIRKAAKRGVWLTTQLIMETRKPLPEPESISAGLKPPTR